MCCSQRPIACIADCALSIFEGVLWNHQSLEVQDLTAEDMQYVSSILDSCREQDHVLPEVQNGIKSLIESIVHQASGFFLWVRLVI